MRYGIIAGNGRFPLLALDAARQQGDEVVAIGIEGEASRDIEALAAVTHWISIAALSKLIGILKEERITEILFCGQVKHVSLFSALRPDWRLAKLLFSLKRRNTDSILGGVIQALEEEGIHVADSTRLLKPLLAPEGVLTRRAPSDDEAEDIAYGRQVAEALSGFDIGQSVAIAERACVAVEAMEGTDEMLRRASALTRGRRDLRLIKAARRRVHMKFDVPVVGPETISVMKETKTTALAITAGRTLMLDRELVLQSANDAKITIIGYTAEEEAN